MAKVRIKTLEVEMQTIKQSQDFIKKMMQQQKIFNGPSI